jgi:hypothetical protein
MPKGQKRPELAFPEPFLDGDKRHDIPRHPGMDVTGPVPVTSPTSSMRMEDFVSSQKQAPAPPVSAGSAPIQFVPVQMVPAPVGTVPQAQVPAPAAAPAPAPAPAAAKP